jgi:addiction module RelB/DinJ family antitoxin
MGVKPSQAVRWFFQHMRQNKRFPFEVGHTPNAQTAQALLEAKNTKDYKRFDSVDDLFADLRS